jgi:hypothetical protein
MIATSGRLIRRLDAQRRRRRLAGARLFLFEHATTANKGSDVLLAEVASGWDFAERRGEAGAITSLELVVAERPSLPKSTLRRVSAWAVVADGATEGELYRASMEGVPAHAGEVGHRFRSTGRTAGTYTLPEEP